MLNTRTRKRRQSASTPGLRRTLERTWHALIGRIPQGVPEITGFAAILLAGLAQLLAVGVGARLPGVVACLLGAAGLLWQGRLWRRRVLEEERRRQKIRMRAEQRTARRSREAAERDERMKRAAIDAIARERAKEIQDARHMMEVEQSAAAERTRRARDEEISREAKRLLTLDEENLQQAVVQAFEDRGFRVIRVADEADCDLVLEGPDGVAKTAARRAPQGHRPEADDIRALEAWREETGASTACMISLAGFTVGAVRLASRLPITLVEAHLLAQWRFSECDDRVHAGESGRGRI